MSTEAIPFSPIDLVGSRPQLQVIEGLRKTSRELYEDYVVLRQRADSLDKIEGTELEAIQEEVRDWVCDEGILADVPDYATYSRGKVADKILKLTDYMEQFHSDVVSQDELEASRLFVESSFALYEDTEQGESGAKDGSFAFVVPMRASRHRADYGQEVEMICPVLRYMPNDLRGQMAVGLPPIILDRYKVGDDGNRGYLIMAPVFPDMVEDLDQADARTIAIDKVNDAVDFAVDRFGVKVVGLGATLPAVTNFGRSIRNNSVITTTGHGGTTYLVKDIINRAVYENEVDVRPSIGVLGLGSIGTSMAVTLAEEFPDREIVAFDVDQRRIGRAQKMLARRSSASSTIRAADSEEGLFSSSDVVVSAINSEIDLDEIGADIKGTLIIDDSQPCSFNSEQVESRGGVVANVVGEDTKSLIQRGAYDYGMFSRTSQVFGCEAEAASLALYSQELTQRGMPDKVQQSILEKMAIRGPVDTKHVRLIGALFMKYGIKASK